MNNMEAATADEENKFFIMLAAVALAGMIINVHVSDDVEAKEASINIAMACLRGGANADKILQYLKRHAH